MTGCKAETDIDSWIDQAQVNMFYNNFYFDSDDYNEPIKRFIDDKIWWKIMPKFRKDADIFIRRNYISLNDAYIQITGEEEDSFISVSGQRETIDDYEVGDQKLVRAFFRIDNIVDHYERQVYSSGDLLAQVGGIFSFLKAIGAILVFIFSERLLVAALANRLYQVYDDKKNGSQPNAYSGEEDDPLNNSAATSKLNKSTSKIHSMKDDEESMFYHANPIRNLFKNTMYCK
jgi:hypothetical protein